MRWCHAKGPGNCTTQPPPTAPASSARSAARTTPALTCVSASTKTKRSPRAARAPALRVAAMWRCSTRSTRAPAALAIAPVSSLEASSTTTTSCASDKAVGRRLDRRERGADQARLVVCGNDEGDHRADHRRQPIGKTRARTRSREDAAIGGSNRPESEHRNKPAAFAPNGPLRAIAAGGGTTRGARERAECWFRLSAWVSGRHAYDRPVDGILFPVCASFARAWGSPLRTGTDCVRMRGRPRPPPPQFRKSPMSKLTGKVAVVTGASKGIGAAIATALAAEGAAVVVNYASSKEGADAVVAGITAAGGKAVAVRGDVSKQADAKGLVDAAVKQFGRLDILVNNSGVYGFAPLEEITEERLPPPLQRQRARPAADHAGGAPSIWAKARASSTSVRWSVASRRRTARSTPAPRARSTRSPACSRANSARARSASTRINPGMIETEGTHTAGFIGSDFESGTRRADATRPGRPAEGHCRDRGVPGIGRFGVADRRAVGGRRRAALELRGGERGSPHRLEATRSAME